MGMPPLRNIVPRAKAKGSGFQDAGLIVKEKSRLIGNISVKATLHVNGWNT
jgi:hypothetical protein